MRSLRTKILALLLVSVLTVSFLIGGATIWNAEVVLKKDTIQIMNLICEEKGQGINMRLRSIKQSVETIYRYANTQFTDDKKLWNDKNYIEDYKEKVSDVLWDLAQSTESAVSVYFQFNPKITSDEAGIMLSRKENHADFEKQELMDFSKHGESDSAHSGWYYEPIKNGKPTWLRPHKNESINTTVISYIIPIFRDNVGIGVIGMDIDIRLLKESVEAVSFYDTGYAFIADKNGNIIYHRNYPAGLKIENYDNDMLEMSKIIIDHENEGKVYSYEWRGEEKKLVYKHLINGMHFVTAAPTAEIDKPRNTLLIHFTGILLMVLGVAVALSFYLVGRITKPLVELTGVAEKIAEGDLDVEISCKTKDEVGVLARTMQNGVRELNKYVEHISRLAYTDVMTGAQNNQAYNEDVKQLGQEIMEQKADFTLVLFDINNLKYINDTYGRGRGDTITIAAFAIMKQVFGRQVVYRICDDGFAVILRNTGEEEIQRLKKEFEAELERFNSERNNCPEELWIALGIAHYEPDKDKGFYDVYVRAERQMYQKKNVLDAQKSIREDALKMLRMVFHKILKVDLTQDVYYEIKVYDDECNNEKGFSLSNAEWMARFAARGQIHEDDLDDYYAFANIQSIKARLKAGEDYLSLRYRRKVGSKFRWVKMEIVPGIEYTEEEQIVMLYVRDIHDSYTAEEEYRKELEKMANTDAMTGLYNRHYMNNYCENYVPKKGAKIGVVYCDLNGLKYANDHYGHAAGDELIMKLAKMIRESFPEEMSCRMSGDEFVVILLHRTEEEYWELANKFREKNRGLEVPLTAIGCCFEENVENVGELLTKAEDAMYRDKKQFYEEFPMYKR